MCKLWFAFCLAQKMGARLGTGTLLLKTVRRNQKKQR
jgi:hypothetical protein